MEKIIYLHGQPCKTGDTVIITVDASWMEKYADMSYKTLLRAAADRGNDEVVSITQDGKHFFEVKGMVYIKDDPTLTELFVYQNYMSGCTADFATKECPDLARYKFGWHISFNEKTGKPRPSSSPEIIDIKVLMPKPVVVNTNIVNLHGYNNVTGAPVVLVVRKSNFYGLMKPAIDRIEDAVAKGIIKTSIEITEGSDDTCYYIPGLLHASVDTHRIAVFQNYLGGFKPTLKGPETALFKDMKYAWTVAIDHDTNRPFVNSADAVDVIPIFLYEKYIKPVLPIMQNIYSGPTPLVPPGKCPWLPASISSLNHSMSSDSSESHGIWHGGGSKVETQSRHVIDRDVDTGPLLKHRPTLKL